MQTFLPYKDFKKTARCLDYKRLGKQRVEAMQILNVLEGKSEGWKNHPAIKMWKGYEEALKLYMNTIIAEWLERGYNNTMLKAKIDLSCLIFPPWIGKYKLHRSHKSNLLRKDYDYYKKFNWNVKDNLPYYWPTNL